MDHKLIEKDVFSKEGDSADIKISRLERIIFKQRQEIKNIKKAHNALLKNLKKAVGCEYYFGPKL